MIMLYGSQDDYDAMAGTSTRQPAWSSDELAALGKFMEEWSAEFMETGEMVSGFGLVAPVHTRRVSLKAGVPVVTDGPYSETQEVLAGYNIVECDSFDRATEIAARLAKCPVPAAVAETYAWHVDVRPIEGGFETGS
ncbi:YciI family protein [Sinosporangium siamense]|nr:YciI family protein [Sinosporangium siamense]